ncbi:WSC domain-containing protein [Pestalotiopsis sp. NC0098]|nr:WSC domain-containing protein [Pestalotiopsis sp. NC0098]
MALLVASVAVDASFTSLGCYSEPSSGRAIEAKSYSDSAMTTESCAAFCADYQLFGTEYSEQCFCGNSLASGSSPATGCTMNCAGDSSETCGGPSRLSLYNNTDYRPTTIATIPGWAYLGCHTEGTNGARVLSYRSPSDVGTPAACASACSAAGYGIAGVEYGSECWCGHELDNGGSYVGDGECSFTCPGDKYSFCGAGNRLVVYQAVVASYVSGWDYQGCYVDQQGDRIFESLRYGSDTAMTAQSCAAFCSQYSYFGVENGNECFCGTSLDASVYSPTSNSSCAMACSGDRLQSCGDASRLSIYESNPPKPAASNQAVVADKFAYQFCAADVGDARVLSDRTEADDAMTVEMCAAFCSDYSFFGVEYGKECYCGNSFAGTSRPESECSFLCPGNSTEWCGAALRLNVWGPSNFTATER